MFLVYDSARWTEYHAESLKVHSPIPLGFHCHRQLTDKQCPFSWVDELWGVVTRDKGKYPLFVLTSVHIKQVNFGETK